MLSSNTPILILEGRSKKEGRVCLNFINDKTILLNPNILITKIFVIYYTVHLAHFGLINNY